MDLSRVSLGLAGALDRDLIREIAPRIEAAGLRGLWLNDTPTGDSIAGLRAAAEVTTTLQLATGVIPLDRRPASEIIAAVHGVPRLTLGVGSGGATGALARVSDGVRELKASLDSPVLVGALGPKMRHLAATEADGALLSWLPPHAAAAAATEQRAAGKRAVLYVRTTVDASARAALEREAAAYESYPSYAANFARLGATALDGSIDGQTELAPQIERYLDAVDEVVLRAIVAEPSLSAYEHFVSSLVE